MSKTKTPVAQPQAATPKTEWRFVCRGNPSAPPLVLNSYWEAQEMHSHPDYYEVDADGLPIANPAESAPTRIPLIIGQRKK